MKKTAIIFGSSGQDGFFLKNLLEKEGINVIKISRTSGDYIGSVGDFEFVEKIIREIKPDFIFHFAANSTIKHYATIDNNNSISTGTINILESIKKYSVNTKIFISGKKCGLSYVNFSKHIFKNLIYPNVYLSLLYFVCRKINFYFNRNNK